MKELLMFFYFLSALILIFNQLSWLILFNERYRTSIELLKMVKEKKELTSEMKSKVGDNALFGIFLMIWLFIGLLTFQWFFYLGFISFLLLIGIINKGERYKKLHWFSSLIGFLFPIFMIINYYHLHIDLEKFLKFF
jgi:hypothetical protein